ncbi:MAG: hypothetical protein ACYTXT_39585 [Nostoc sp.]
MASLPSRAQRRQHVVLGMACSEPVFGGGRKTRGTTRVGVKCVICGYHHDDITKELTEITVWLIITDDCVIYF